MAKRGPQDFIITQRYLNTSTYVGDATPGAVVQTSNVSGSIVQSYGGMLGGIMSLDYAAANYYSDPTLGQQLYPGDYQYVQFFASSSASAAVQGQVVFWLNDGATTKNMLAGKFIVTPDFAAPQYPIAGIALANTAKGNYWWIQVAGIAEVKFGTLINKLTPQVSDLVYVNTTPTQYADVFPDNETISASLLKVVLGRAWSVAPVANTISPVILSIGGPQPMQGGGGGEG